MNRQFSLLLQTFTYTIVALARANLERKIQRERRLPRPRLHSPRLTATTSRSAS